MVGASGQLVHDAVSLLFIIILSNIYVTTLLRVVCSAQTPFQALTTMSLPSLMAKVWPVEEEPSVSPYNVRMNSC